MARILEKAGSMEEKGMTSKECAGRLLKFTGISERQMSFLEEAIDNVSECFTCINEKDCLLELCDMNRKYMGALSDVILTIRSIKFECSWEEVGYQKIYCLELQNNWDMSLARKKKIVVKRHGFGIENKSANTPVASLYY